VRTILTAPSRNNLTYLLTVVSDHILVTKSMKIAGYNCLFSELVYDDVFVVWETIWAAKHVSSPHFVLFIALALVEYYREIIIDNSMDFTNIIKFFNGIIHCHSTTRNVIFYLLF